MTTMARPPRGSSRPDGRPLLRGWSHALALPLALIGAAALLESTSGGWTARLSVLAFGATMTGLYAVSSVYHLGRWNDRARAILARCDGAMILLFIVGTFTPVAFHTLDGSWRQWSLLVAWVVGIVGAGIAISPLEAPRWVGTLCYIAIGWLTVVPLTRVMAALPAEGLGLIALGGVLYTVGAVIYARKWPDPFPTWFGYHEIWHLFVIAATTAHYLAISRYVLPIS